MSRSISSSGLPGLLHRVLLSGDVNECCGVLRRVFCECREDEVNLLRRQVESVIALGRGCVRAEPSIVRPASYAILSHASQQVGDWVGALHFAQHLELPPSPYFLASLLRSQNVSAVLERCRHHGWSVDVPNAIRVLAMEHGSWAAALAVAERAETELGWVERYSAGVVIPLLASAGEWEAATRVLTRGLAEGSFTDASMMSNLVRATATPLQWRTCLSVLGCLQRTMESATALPDSPDLFRDVVRICPSWQSAIEVVNLARSVGLSPDKDTVCVALRLCEVQGAWAAAAALYDTSVAENFVSSLASDSYGALVRSLHAAHQWEKALAALSWMGRASEAAAAAGRAELLELCEQSGQWEAALSITATLMEEPHLLTQSTCLSVLFACAKGSQWEKAAWFYTSMLTDVRLAPPPLAVCAVLQACYASRQWHAALRCYSAARLASPRVVTPPLAHQLVLKSCVVAQRWADALSVLEVMAAEGLPQDNHSQRLGLWAAALAGSWSQSLEYYERIPKLYRSQRDYHVITSSIRSSGSLASAAAIPHLARLQRRLV